LSHDTVAAWSCIAAPTDLPNSAGRDGAERTGPQSSREPLLPKPRRFPPPWTVEELVACFIVRDANGQALGYVYFEDEPGCRAAA